MAIDFVLNGCFKNLLPSFIRCKVNKNKHAHDIVIRSTEQLIAKRVTCKLARVHCMLHAVTFIFFTDIFPRQVSVAASETTHFLT